MLVDKDAIAKQYQTQEGKMLPYCIEGARAMSYSTQDSPHNEEFFYHKYH